MSDFKINDEKISFIAKKFNIKKDTVQDLYNYYKNIEETNTNQYLAHVMRSLEEYVRKVCNAPFFRIICKASSANSNLNGVGCASYKENFSFCIIYDSSLSPKDARVVIAHELGHLFWTLTLKQEYNQKHEPLSSVFGVFTMLDKNDFYANKTALYQHHSWDEIVNDFLLLKNREDGKFNIS